MEKYILAHDLGTSGNKAVLFDEGGAILGSETVPYPTYSPGHGRYEQNPDDLWKAVVEGTRRLLQGRDASRIAAISFSNQMHGCICVDKQGTPLYPAMIWSDQRATVEMRWLEEHIGAREVYEITGNRPNVCYTLAKLMWIRTNQPQVFGNTHKVLHSKEYVIYKLTGEFVTEPTDASGTNLYDLRERDWSAKIFGATGLDVILMPKLMKTTDVAGTVTAQAAAELGLPAGVPVVCGGADGIMAALGAGCIRPGQVCINMGTSAYAAATSTEPLFDPGMTTFTYAHAVDGWYLPCGAMSCGGLSYAWIRDVVGELDVVRAKELGRNVYQMLDEIAQAAEPGAGGLLFLPYLTGERCPRWNTDARGAFIGLTPKHTKGDMLRSVMEGVAYNLDIILQVFRAHLDIHTLRLIGGGAKGDVWSQIVADVSDLKVEKLGDIEYSSSIGAAITAGVGTGMFKDYDVVDQFLQVNKTLYPAPDRTAVYGGLKPLFEQSYQGLVDVFTGLAAHQKGSGE